VTASDKDLLAAIAVTRFGMGARPGEIAAAKADPHGWLASQIRSEGADQPDFGPSGPPTVRQNLTQLAAAREQVQADSDPEMRKRALAPLKAQVSSEALVRAQLGATTPAGFRERWTLFWCNHFTVAAKRLDVAAAVGPFEREAIRPHVFGRFEDLLVASTSHPGMLLYLDQAQSIGPDSMRAAREGKGGLNENLAREIMELHTVGVDAGYTQADVTEFARALTGWSMGGPRSRTDEGVFIYRVAMHEPGPRQVMGRRYDEPQQDQARAILADLARDPHTSRRIARKIAAHFVADEPPSALVATLDSAWRESHGDLAQVARALIGSPEAWIPAAGKLKTPYEFLVSAWRAADWEPEDANQDVVLPLNLLGQRPYLTPQPNGWSDLAADWAAPDAIVKRLTWSQAFAGAHVPPGRPTDVAMDALGERLGDAALKTVARAESRPEAFAILLMSPEFQRR
jgi:uncharacterized protein (DUF1800 family)